MALLGAAAVAALAGGGVWLLSSPRFEVKHVDVRGTQHLTAERVLEAARIPPGRNLFLIDPRAPPPAAPRGADEWDERLARLEGVLAQTAAREGGVRMVDLRFRDQVVLQGGR